MLNKHISLYKYEKIPLDVSTVVWVGSDINYCCLYLIDGRKIIIAKTLKSFEEKLVEFDNFFRPNKNFIINRNFIKVNKVGKYGGEIVLINDFSVTVSRRRVKFVKEKLSIRK